MAFQDVYNLGGANHAIFYAVNSIHDSWWNALMMMGTRLGNFYTAFGWYMAIAGLILLWRTHLLRTSKEGIAPAAELGRVLLVLTSVAVAHVISQELSETIKHAIPMPRPYIALPEGTVTKLDTWLTEKHNLQSFPSGHATFTATMLVGFWPLMNRRVKIIASIMALWVLTSRMALGVHFPSDLMTGFALGTVTVLAVRQLLKFACNPALSFPRLK